VTLGERMGRALFPWSVRRAENIWNADLNELERESDRSHTIRLLAHIGDRRAIPLIREFLLDNSNMVRVAARVALEQMERKPREEL
jgi:HEAT repeat protein